jgi:hypothetical protein
MILKSRAADVYAAFARILRKRGIRAGDENVLFSARADMTYRKDWGHAKSADRTSKEADYG